MFSILKSFKTAERVSENDPSDNFVYQRSVLAYHKSADLISGTILEIGTGNGYGIDIIAPKSEKFITIDKIKQSPKKGTCPTNVQYIQMKVPVLKNIPDQTFDFVISFQVIEHILNDNLFLQEINRVLKRNGQMIISTPNKKMSITRNPWHVREYSVSELKVLLLMNNFHPTQTLGVFGNRRIIEHFNKNVAAVKKILRYDVLNLQHRLPRQLLQVPYDILNRLNRNKLFKEDNSLKTLTTNDYYFAEANDHCFDLFFVARKQ